MQDPPQGDIQRSSIVERHIGAWSKPVEVAKPSARTASRPVPRVGGVDVTIGQDEVAGLQQGQDLALTAVGEIGRVTSFGQDAAGELYITNSGGEILKLVPGP